MDFHEQKPRFCTPITQGLEPHIEPNLTNYNKDAYVLYLKCRLFKDK